MEIEKAVQSRAALAQETRFIFYAANFEGMDDLIAYLTDNCCQGGQLKCR